ncbi:TrmH family RNA methyltransferase [Maribacter sp. R77961]|uniref:TrmH family RNA methyltransferase n=1 Tax=Maribacter sp. R77961 TaxID=3093871 RepID=UPI0037C88853
MLETKHISSAQNTLVKKIVLLRDKSKERKKTGLFILEGKRELELAQQGNYDIKTVLYNEKLVTISTLKDNFNLYNNTILIGVTQEVYDKIAYRNTTEGIVAITKAKSHNLSQLKLKTKNPLILVAEAPEKPGNIGALLRTADAANLDAVLIANPKTDLYNPNIIRSSVGCVFTGTIATGTSSELIGYLKNHEIDIYCAALTASKDYSLINYKKPTAIVVGTENSGLSDIWLEQSTQNIIIPMEGHIDSMNVSVSAAILIFEAKRQRKS